MGNRKKARGADRKAKSAARRGETKRDPNVLHAADLMSAASMELSVTTEELDFTEPYVDHFSTPGHIFDKVCYASLIAFLRARGPEYTSAKCGRRRCYTCGRAGSLAEPAYLVCAGCCVLNYCSEECQCQC